MLTDMDVTAVDRIDKGFPMLSLRNCFMAGIILLAVSVVSSVSAKLPGGADSAPSRFKVVWKEGRLSVTAERASLSRVLAEIARQTGLEIRGSQIPNKEVSATFSNVSLREGLHQLLDPMNYAFVEKPTSNGRAGQPSALLVIAADDEPKSGRVRATTPADRGMQPNEMQTTGVAASDDAAHMKDQQAAEASNEEEGNQDDGHTAQAGTTQQGVNGASAMMLPPALPDEGLKLATDRPAPAMIPDEGIVIKSSRSGLLPIPENGVNLEQQQSQGGRVQMGK
jgi:hypothetical protein